MAAKLGQEIGKSGPFESLEQEVLLNCLKTADWFSRAADDVLKPAGLSGTQYNVLRILRGVGDGGIPCQEIGQRMITRDPDLTRLLDRLEKRGLVSRQRQDQDRRIVRARISQAGLELLGQLDEPVRDVHHRLLSHLSQEKLAQLSQLLEQARDHSATKDAVECL